MQHRVGAHHVEDRARDDAEPGPEDIGPERHPGEPETVIEEVKGENRHQAGQGDDNGAVLFGEFIETAEFFILAQPVDYRLPGEIAAHEERQAGPQGGPDINHDDPPHRAEQGGCGHRDGRRRDGRHHRHHVNQDEYQGAQGAQALDPVPQVPQLVGEAQEPRQYQDSDDQGHQNHRPPPLAARRLLARRTDPGTQAQGLGRSFRLEHPWMAVPLGLNQ